MTAVYRYVLAQTGDQELVMPRGAKILSARWWRGEWGLWALVDAGSGLEETRRFRAFGTGHPVTGEVDRLRYLGTVTDEATALAFHLFEHV